MKSTFCSILFLLLAGIHVVAQGSLAGTISDSNGEPIPGVIITLDNGEIQTATDADGFYMLNPLQKMNYQLELRVDGFKKISESVKIEGRTFVDFTLSRNCWYYWIRFKKC